MAKKTDPRPSSKTSGAETPEFLNRIGANPADVLAAYEAGLKLPRNGRGGGTGVSLLLGVLGGLLGMAVITAAILWAPPVRGVVARALSSIPVQPTATPIPPPKPTLTATAPTKTLSATSAVSSITLTPGATATSLPISVTQLSFIVGQSELKELVLPSGTTSVEITITARSADGKPVPGSAIALTLGSTGGVLSDEKVTTGADGTARFVYHPPENPTQLAKITAQSDKATASLPIKPPAVTPSPPSEIKVVIKPAEFDIGIDETATVLVRVSKGDAGEPMSGIQVTLSIEPAGLAQIARTETITVTTDEYGETLEQELVGKQVGVGSLTAQLASGETTTAALTIRPVAVVKNDSANLRSTPDSSSDKNVMGATIKGDRFVIVGRNTKGDWWQVRLADGQTAWISNVTVQVKGDVAKPGAFPPGVQSTATVTATATLTPTLPATATLTPTLTATTKPTATRTPQPTVIPKPTVTAPTQTPTTVPTEGYPDPGSYTVVVSPGTGVATVYRAGSTKAEDALADLPAGGSVKVLSPEQDSARPVSNGYVLVSVAFWVPKDRLAQVSGGWTLTASNQTALACWEVRDDGSGNYECEGRGPLLPIPAGYFARPDTPVERGDWRRPTIWAWMKRENIGSKQ